MSGLLAGIRNSASSYEIFPIDQREEELDEFVPYGKRRDRLGARFAQSLQLKLTKINLYQSQDGKSRPQLKGIRYKTQQKEDEKIAVKISQLQINTSIKLLPHTIHSKKKDAQKSQERSRQKNSRLARLQSEMDKLRPVFFKQGHLQEGERPTRSLLLDVFRSSEHLKELKSRPKDSNTSNKISRKQLMRLIRVEKVQSSWQPTSSLKLARSSQHAQIP